MVDMDGMFIRDADAEHPPVPRAAPNRRANLVGKRLKCHQLVRPGQAAGDPCHWVLAAHGPAKRGDRLFEPALHQVEKAIGRDQPRIGNLG